MDTLGKIILIGSAAACLLAWGYVAYVLYILLEG